MSQSKLRPGRGPVGMLVASEFSVSSTSEGRGPKYFWTSADSATGPVANIGQTVYFRVVVTNIGNVTLSNVDVQDQVTAGTGNPLDFTFGAVCEAASHAAYQKFD